MAKVTARKNIRISEDIDLDYMLGHMPIEVRNKALAAAASAACRIVVADAKRRVVVGNTRHNPEAKPLKETIGYVIRKYNGDKKVLGVVGPQYPAGAHGHLVEEGHVVKVSRGLRKGQAPLSGSAKVPGKEYMAPAVDTTQGKQDDAVIRTLQRYIMKNGG